MLIIRDRNDTFGLGALGGSPGFLSGALGGSLGFTSGALGCSSVSLGAVLVSFWRLLRPSEPPMRCSGVLQNDFQTTFASQTSISRKCYYLIEAALRRGTAAPRFLAGLAGLKRSGG